MTCVSQILQTFLKFIQRIHSTNSFNVHSTIHSTNSFNDSFNDSLKHHIYNFYVSIFTNKKPQNSNHRISRFLCMKPIADFPRDLKLHFYTLLQYPGFSPHHFCL